ncbi:MAG: carbohydrate kinase [Spirochaetales bacterium]|nr:carbohydrate kinase [Spirochaetales bacterium]
MDYVIAVFDIGKTNKKLILFDNNLKELASTYSVFPMLKTGDIEVEDIDGINNWILKSLSQYSKKYPIKVIAFSTQGATFVSIGKKGKPSMPVVSYTNEPGASFHNEFYRLAGNPIELQKITATPKFGTLLNIAKGIFYVKNKYPDSYNRTEYFLLYPQYFSFFLTGEIAADYTYAGCHSYLWDFKRNNWSLVAERLNIINKLPANILKPSSVLGRIKPDIVSATGLSSDTVVTPGIHDSNASLLPYLIKEGDEFVLNSTGTWCVIMHPMDKVYFSKEELGKVVFYNLSAFGTPVKTTIFTGGLEHDAYMKIIQKVNGINSLPNFNELIYKRIVKEKKLFILPSLLKGSGQFPDSTPRVYENGKRYLYSDISDTEYAKDIPAFFNDPVTARAVLNISLAVQTETAFNRSGIKDGMTVFTEGGFRKNEGYNLLVSSLFPNSKFFLSNIKEASAFGAALTAKSAYEGRELNSLGSSFKMETKTINKMDFHGLPAYRDAFLDLL